MTAFNQLLSLASVLSASEFQELGIAISNYESRGSLCESKSKAVNVAFMLIKISMDEDFESAESKHIKRAEAGRRGAAKRWGTDSKNSNDSNDSNAINAIQSHSEPYLGDNVEEVPDTLSPTTPISLPEEETDPLKEKLSLESKKKTPPTIEERKIAFGKGLEQYTGEGEGKFPRSMVLDFYRYWTEASPGARKMRWEKETVFDPKARLEYWQRREQEKQQKNNSNYGTGYKSNNRANKDDFEGCVYESSIQV